jgi:membrane fusion protein, multidrug efflux system
MRDNIDGCSESERNEVDMNARFFCWRDFGPRVLIIVLLSAFATGCSSQSPPDSAIIRPVRTTIVVAGEEPQTRVFPGKVEASKAAELAFQVSGLLINIPIKEGQRVAQGELIAQLRQDEFGARLQAAEGQLDQARAMLAAQQAGERPEEQFRRETQVRGAEAKLNNARTEYHRLAQVSQSNPNAIARVDYDRAKTNYQLAQEEYLATVQLLEKGTIGREEDIAAQEANVRGLEARVVEAKIQLEDTTLRAPFDGVIARRFVEQNQNVRAKEPVVKFQDVDEISIAVDVPESVMAADLQLSEIVQIFAEFSAAPGLQFPVRISEMARTADPITQTFLVRVAMKVPPNLNLLPGMSASVTMSYRRASILGAHILVPISAVAKDAAGEQVAWVIGPDQIVERRKVKVGEAMGGSIEIVEGLQPGDRIAVAGVSFLRDRMKVRDLGDAF